MNYLGTPLIIIDTYLDSFFLIDLSELYFSDFFQIISVSFRPHTACLSVCFSFCLFACFSFRMFVYLFVCLFLLSVWFSVLVFGCLSVFAFCPSACLSACLLVALSVLSSIFLSVCLVACLSVCLSSVCLSVCLFICLPACLSFSLVWFVICLPACLFVFFSWLLSFLFRCLVVCLSSFCPFVCLFVFWSVNVSVCLFVFLFFCLSVCLPVVTLCPDCQVNFENKKHQQALSLLLMVFSRPIRPCGDTYIHWFWLSGWVCQSLTGDPEEESVLNTSRGPLNWIHT